MPLGQGLDARLPVLFEVEQFQTERQHGSVGSVAKGVAPVLKQSQGPPKVLLLQHLFRAEVSSLEHGAEFQRPDHALKV